MEFAFDSQQRLTGMVPNEETAATQAFTYDGASRLKTSALGGVEGKYVYAESSSRLERTEFRNASVQKGRTDRTYDPKGRLGEITTRRQSSSKSLSSHAYSYNALNQRTQANLENGARWNFAYDDLGQVVEGKKRNAPGNLVPGRQFEYTFDTIGNRTETKTNGRTATYSANTLNQYTERQVPGAIDVSGEADPVAAVRVEGLPAARQLEYFYKEIAVSNGSAPVYEEIRTEAARDGLTTEKIGFEYLAKTPEAITYDDDGNCLSDGQFTYTWDASNRLVGLESISGAPTLSKRKATFGYDPLSRRTSKKVWEWDDLTSGYVVKEDLRFLYHGWNLMAEINAEGDMVRSHLWGLDLSGSMQGAGGVGGLLCTTSYGLATEQWFPAYDGNGNAMAMVNTATGEAQARFEYDPSGREVRATGPALAHAKFRFSSKYFDGESGLSYYGFRYYSPDTGRWVNRDPIGEQGGVNLYAIVANNPVNLWDPFGLESYIVYGTSGFHTYGHVGIISRNPSTGVYTRLDYNGGTITQHTGKDPIALLTLNTEKTDIALIIPDDGISDANIDAARESFVKARKGVSSGGTLNNNCGTSTSDIMKAAGIPYSWKITPNDALEANLKARSYGTIIIGPRTPRLDDILKRAGK